MIDEKRIRCENCGAEFHIKVTPDYEVGQNWNAPLAILKMIDSCPACGDGVTVIEEIPGEPIIDTAIYYTCPHCGKTSGIIHDEAMETGVEIFWACEFCGGESRVLITRG